MINIQDIAGQSGVSVDGMGYGEGNVESFALAIVDECIRLINDQEKIVADMVVHTELDAFWNRARIVQSQRIVTNIKERFGIK